MEVDMVLISSMFDHALTAWLLLMRLSIIPDKTTLYLTLINNMSR
jgi:hypothetical protein